MFRIICIFALWIGWSGYHPTSGKSVAASTFLLTDVIKKTDRMKGKKRNLDEVLTLFKSKHGNKYDYSLVDSTTFLNMNQKVPIICREHGIFNQSPHSHLYYGCPLCGRLTQGGGIHHKKRRKVLGIGINDYDGAISVHNIKIPAYSVWKFMLSRCYGADNAANSYKDCFVCDEWLSFLNFKKWFDDPKNNYRNGYHLDKDILIKGNKVYSPQTCCFVPPEINTLFVNRKAARGDFPIGVSRINGNGNYRASFRKNGERVVLGVYKTPKEAFEAYKYAKEKHIKDIAKQYYWNSLITPKVYNALMNYKVEITD